MKSKNLSRPLRRTPPLKWLQTYAGAEAEKILEFCLQHDMLNELKTAVGLAIMRFLPPDVRASDVKLKKVIDPETGHTQIVISLLIRNKSRDEVLAAYRAYIEQSAKCVPWPKSSFIGLSYDIS
jgi:hypothetical protein